MVQKVDVEIANDDGGFWTSRQTSQILNELCFISTARDVNVNDVQISTGDARHLVQFLVDCSGYLKVGSVVSSDSFPATLIHKMSLISRNIELIRLVTLAPSFLQGNDISCDMIVVEEALVMANQRTDIETCDLCFLPNDFFLIIQRVFLQSLKLGHCRGRRVNLIA